MKELFIYASIVAVLSVVSTISGADVQQEMKTAAEARSGNEPGYTDGSKSVRYRQERRNIDRMYQEGALTRTEYIQRKRQIDSLN